MDSANNSSQLAKCVMLREYGGYDKLTVEMLSVALPQPGQVLVEIKACGMNFADLYTRQGLFRSADLPKPPFVMGREAAGQIQKIGEEVDAFKVGDRVACISNKIGLWTELACVDAADCILIPDNMSFEDAASFYVNYLTAYCSIFYFGNLRPNEKIFIHSLAGGVGWAATQLAKSVPGVTVLGTASPWKNDEIKNNGVDFCVAATNTNYVEEILSKYPKGIDVVLDNRSGADFHNERNMLGQMGKIVHLGANNILQGEHRSIFKLLRTWWSLKNISIFSLIMANQAVCGFNLDILKEKCPQRFNDAVKEVNALYAAEKIQPRIDSVWAFEEVSKATQHMTSRKNIGKIILKVC